MSNIQISQILQTIQKSRRSYRSCRSCRPTDKNVHIMQIVHTPFRWTDHTDHTYSTQVGHTNPYPNLVFLRLKRTKIWLVGLDSRWWSNCFISHRSPESTKRSQRSYTTTLTTLVLLQLLGYRRARLPEISLPVQPSHVWSGCNKLCHSKPVFRKYQASQWSRPLAAWNNSCIATEALFGREIKKYGGGRNGDPCCPQHLMCVCVICLLARFLSRKIFNTSNNVTLDVVC